VFVIGMYVVSQSPVSEEPWLLPFGVVPEGWMMPDYRPLLPWFGVVLTGLGFGNLVYGDGKRPEALPQESPTLARPLLPLGRNSLLIYLVHQPVLVTLLALFGIVDLNLF
ncbi:MAG: DUF1624 domain-containing protein, partial [Actinomycetota bacterium]|nr:DUF1624 domain-containing protein [Actinomycetota bacterium]